MKGTLIACLAAIVGFLVIFPLLSSIGGDDEIDFAEPQIGQDIGSVVDDQFISPMFGFSLNLPSGWNAVPRQQQEEFIGIGLDSPQLVENEQTRDAFVQSAKNLYALFQTLERPYGEYSTFNPNMNAVATILPAGSDSVGVLEVAKEIEAFLPSMNKNIRITESSHLETIGGEEFGVLGSELIINNILMKQRQCVTIINGYIVNITLSYGENHQLDTMMASLRTFSLQ